MKTKLVLWGTNAQDEKILIAMELRSKDNKVNIFTFPEPVATEDFSQKMLQEWRNGTEVPFPEHTLLERELSVTGSLLPDDIRVERTDVVTRAQTEWHFIVLSSKLNEVYETELGELKEKVSQLTNYSTDVWDELKGFWGKVQEQVRDRNLFREHANSLRDNTNSLFNRLKELRANLDAEFQTLSQEAHDTFLTAIDDIEKRVNAGGRLAALFDELKDLQRKFRDSKLTRDHRSTVWDKLDGTFKMVKEKRFGASATNESSASERLQRRYNGLINAIDKMQKSIDRDDKDLEFQNRKIATTDGQLEAQIRQAKIKMIEERIRSKREKLNEMNQTKTELEQRMVSQKDKDAKRAERQKLEAAKAAAKEKIASRIKNAEDSRTEEDASKLEKAAAVLTGTAKVKAGSTEVETTADTAVEVLEQPKVEAVTATAEVVVETTETAVSEVVQAAPTTTELIDNAVNTATGVASANSTSDEEE